MATKRDYVLFDDRFLRICLMENAEKLIEDMINHILDEPIRVIKYHTQYDIPNSLGRELRLDVLVVDKDGRKINIEIQQDLKNADIKRLRYHQALIDTHTFKKKQKFSELGQVVIIFITLEDYFKMGLPKYEIVRYNKSTKEICDDGTLFIYVNGSYDGNHKIADLVHDMKEASPQNMKIDSFKKRIDEVKRSDIMTQIEIERIKELEEAEALGVLKEKKENAVSFYKNGVSKDIICKSLDITEEYFDSIIKESE